MCSSYHLLMMYVDVAVLTELEQKQPLCFEYTFPRQIQNTLSVLFLLISGADLARLSELCAVEFHNAKARQLHIFGSSFS